MTVRASSPLIMAAALPESMREGGDKYPLCLMKKPHLTGERSFAHDPEMLRGRLLELYKTVCSMRGHGRSCDGTPAFATIGKICAPRPAGDGRQSAPTCVGKARAGRPEGKKSRLPRKRHCPGAGGCSGEDPSRNWERRCHPPAAGKGARRSDIPGREYE